MSDMIRADAKRDYQKDGYLYLPEMLSKAEVATYKAEIDRVFQLETDPLHDPVATGKTFTCADGITKNAAFCQQMDKF